MVPPVTMPPELRLEGDGPVRTLILNRPEHRNAANVAMHEGLADVWNQLARDPDLKVIVLTGAGPAFSAGGDMDFLQRVAEDPDFRYVTMRDARRIVTEMINFPLPIVAAVNGPAVGLGCSLAVLCDVVLLSEAAFLADPHVTLGVVAADGGVLAWPLMTSLLRAKEFLLTGDRISPETALAIGLANAVLPPEKLMPEAMALAERLARQPSQALRDTKRALNLHLSRAVANVIDFAFSAEAETFALPTFRDSIDQHRTRFGTSQQPTA